MSPRRHLPQAKQPPLPEIADRELYVAARRAGCTERQARFLAVYVVTSGYKQAAAEMGITEQAAKSLSARLREQFGAPHMAAVVRRVYTKVTRAYT